MDRSQIKVEVSNEINTSNEELMEYCKELVEAIPFNNKILLIQIPQVILDSFNKDTAHAGGYYIFPPTGLQYLYESIKTRGIEVRILDINYEILKRTHEDETFDHNSWPMILIEELDNFEPSVVGVSCLFDVGISPMLDALKIIRKRKDSIVIGGGVIATYEWDKLLTDELCHFVIEGEGENKLNYLLDNISNTQQDYISTPEIHFKRGDKKLITYGEPDIVEVKTDLVDSYKLINIKDYHKYGSLNPFSRRAETQKIPFAAIQLSRGCRAACSFCAVRDFMGKGVRFRTVKDILTEMDYLINKEGVGHFELLDDDPTFYRAELKELLREIIKRKWDIKWSANNGMIAAAIDEELLGLMRDSGCIGFKIGIETGNPEMLKIIKKPASHNRFKQFSKILDNYSEIFVGGNYIIGLPDETFSMMLDSFRFSINVNLDWSAYTVCQIIRGASAFADSGEYFDNQMESSGKNVTNFIPSRNSSKGEVLHKTEVLKGLDIFELGHDKVPDEEQVTELWFTFNVIVNYIYNKNLSVRGRPEKFIDWVERVLMAYPTNPYMNLFVGLAYVLKNENDVAQKYFNNTVEIVKGSDYWKTRFEQFGFNVLLNNSFPNNKEDVYATLFVLQKRVEKFSKFIPTYQ